MTNRDTREEILVFKGWALMSCMGQLLIQTWERSVSRLCIVTLLI